MGHTSFWPLLMTLIFLEKTNVDGDDWSASRPGGALAAWRGPPVLIVQEAGWASQPVWTQRLKEQSFASAGDRTSIARPSSPYPDTVLSDLPRLPLEHTAAHSDLGRH
jgi:hypothetical protein